MPRMEWETPAKISRNGSMRNYRNQVPIKRVPIKIKNQGHPMWPALREVFGKVKETEQYRKIQRSDIGCQILISGLVDILISNQET